ncbi:hypothetical protein LOD99_12900 [Oopsacas minuta]|uniref:Uncharacterized protein n=1 Tax=Oopsacas minuta TaxID=111878 RepID=A0AAV7J7U3_9METZ|nr:hypothetical protein LOD99_12900 [Oopsacas minuta]
MSDSIADPNPLQPLKCSRSLLSWINSFESIKSELSSITDLSDSTLLIDCMIFATADKTALPCTLFQEYSDIQNVKSHEYTFSKILAVFSEFFRIPLEQAISLPDLLSGNEHELIKLLLIFLAYAVQQKPNELIIQGILNLDIEVQVCLLKLFEYMFQILDRKQIEAVHDLVTNLDLETEETPETDQKVEEIDKFMMTESPDITNTVTPPLQASPNLLTLETPVLQKVPPLYESPANEDYQKQESLFGVTSRYYGFDSPAALKWINRLEIKHPLKRPDFTRPTPAKINQLHQLQHKINQQQEEFHILRNFCQETETELIEKIKQLAESELTCKEMSEKYNQCDDLLGERVSLCDQVHSLEREKQSLKKDVTALIGYKDKCENLQDMADELASTAKGNQTLIMNAEKLQLELTSEKDKMFQLESEKTILERTNMGYQASVQLLGQEKQVIQEELELVRERLVQLEGDISALKKF